MRAFLWLSAAVALLGAFAAPAAAGGRDAMTVSVVVLPSCTVAVERSGDGFVPRLWCSTPSPPANDEPGRADLLGSAFTPMVETVAGPGGAVLRVTY